MMEPERLLNPDGFASVVQLLSSLSGNSGGQWPWRWGSTVIAASFRDAAPAAEWPASLATLWTGAGAAYVLASLLFRRLPARAFPGSLESRNVARLSRLWARLQGVPVPPPNRLGSPGRRPPGGDWIRALGWLAPAGYAALVTGGGAVLGRGLPPAAHARLPGVYATMHAAWGVGFLSSPPGLREPSEPGDG